MASTGQVLRSQNVFVKALKVSQDSWKYTLRVAMERDSLHASTGSILGQNGCLPLPMFRHADGDLTPVFLVPKAGSN